MISLSIERAMEKVMARAALRHVLHSDRPELLTQGNRAAVAKVMETAFHTMCAALIPHICGAEGDFDGEELRMEMGPEAGKCAESVLRPLLEEALVCYTLHLCYLSADHCMAQGELESFNGLMKQVRGSMGLSGVQPVMPFWL